MKAIFAAIAVLSFGVAGMAAPVSEQTPTPAPPEQPTGDGIKPGEAITKRWGMNLVQTPACPQAILLGGAPSATRIVRIDGSQETLRKLPSLDRLDNLRPWFPRGFTLVPQPQREPAIPAPVRPMPLPNWSGGTLASPLPLAQGAPPVILVTGKPVPLR